MIKSSFIDAPILNYVRDHMREMDSVLKELRAENTNHPLARMQISPEQGPLMELLVRMVNARKAIEIGVFTGYSSICIARALPEDCKLIACDISEEHTATARKYWQKAKIEHKIDLRIAPANETLQKLIDAGESGTFDFVFIDANKNQYDEYYELSLKLLRTGGIIVLDNMLWKGEVVLPYGEDNMRDAVKKLNEKIKSDPRVMSSLLPMADGIHLALKK